MPASHGRNSTKAFRQLRDQLALLSVDIERAFHISDCKVWLHDRIACPRGFEDACICTSIIVVIHTVFRLEIAQIIWVQLTWVKIPDLRNRRSSAAP